MSMSVWSYVVPVKIFIKQGQMGRGCGIEQQYGIPRVPGSSPGNAVHFTYPVTFGGSLWIHVVPALFREDSVTNL